MYAVIFFGNSKQPVRTGSQKGMFQRNNEQKKEDLKNKVQIYINFMNTVHLSLYQDPEYD